MATQDSTLPAVDYLGHPCQVAEARDYFAESVSLARDIAAREPREIARQLGRHLNELNERICQLHDALLVANEALPDSDETDGARAVLTMAHEHAMTTANSFFGFAGLVLVSIEQQRAREVAHG